MITFKEFFLESENNFQVGQKVKFNLQQISSYVDIASLGGEDAGEITAVTGSGYTLRMTNGNEVNIKKEDIYSVGDTDTVSEE